MAAPIDVGHDESVTVAPKTTDDMDAFRASMKLVLASIPYKDCGAGSEGKVQITFDEQGNATSVAVIAGTYDAATTSCLVARFRGVHAPPSASPRTIQWGIHLDASAAKGSWDS